MKTGELRAVNGTVLRTVSITVEEVLNILACMNIDKLPEPDQIYIYENTVGSLR